jgi:hypothetical protein
MTRAVLRAFRRPFLHSVSHDIPFGGEMGVGLLLSLSVLILDKYTPGEWF